MLALTYTVFVFWRVRRRLVTLRRGSGAGSDDASVLPSLGRRFRNYVLVFALVWLPQLINRIDNAARPADPSFALYLLQSICGPLQGLGNALVYGWTPRVRQMYLQRCPGLCPGRQAPESAPLALKGTARARDLSCCRSSDPTAGGTARNPGMQMHSSAVAVPSEENGSAASSAI